MPFGAKSFTPAERAAYVQQWRDIEAQWKDTPFAHDNEMAWRQCQATDCYSRWLHPVQADVVGIPYEQWPLRWRFHRAIVEPNETTLLTTTCSDARAPNRCRLRRYDIASGRLEELPGQEPGRSYFSPAWSPDGKQIAVVTWRCEGPENVRCVRLDPALWLIDRDGRKLRELIGPEQQRAILNISKPGTAALARGIETDRPAFSPDGRKLAYWKSLRGLVLRTGLEGFWHLYEMDLASGKERQLDNIHMGSPEGGPVYLADGRLLFSADFYNPLGQPPAVVREAKTHIFATVPGKVLETADLTPFISPQSTYGQWWAHDVSRDGRYVLFSGLSAKRHGRPSLYLYDSREARTVRKLWEGSNYKLDDKDIPEVGERGGESIGPWSYPLDAHLSDRMNWLVQVDGGIRHPEDGGEIYLRNLRDGSVRHIDGWDFQPWKRPAAAARSN
ncbi:hypothetical protein CCZ27_01635 [Thauera sinica]|nr:hypothetical protein CCZ27_01635 [Thauera sp. K11]